MKSYTDIEQSKKLAEILPLESADYYHAPDADIVITAPYITYFGEEKCIPAYKGAVPCWSLAALLAAIPVITEYNGMFIRLRIDKGSIGNDESAMWYEDLQTNLSTDIEAEADNFVDSCYKMIMRLHELNLL